MKSKENGGQESLLFNLVYCSHAAANFLDSDIEEIVSAARRNNPRSHITGWLVYSSGIFFQWLEGSRDHVNALMAVIAADPRHDTIVVLSEAEEVRERLFSEWDMELVSSQDIRAVLLDAMGATKSAKSVQGLQKIVGELDARATASAAHPLKYRVDEY